jgi:hypothetical protein
MGTQEGTEPPAPYLSCSRTTIHPSPLSHSAKFERPARHDALVSHVYRSVLLPRPVRPGCPGGTRDSGLLQNPDP